MYLRITRWAVVHTWSASTVNRVGQNPVANTQPINLPTGWSHGLWTKPGVWRLERIWVTATHSHRDSLRWERVIDVIAPVVVFPATRKLRINGIVWPVFPPLVLKYICTRTVYTISGTTLLMRPGNRIINLSINIFSRAVLEATGEYIWEMDGFHCQPV